MQPVQFAQANKLFGPPKGMTESQVRTIPAYVGEVKQGSWDGETVVVVAWKPDDQDLKRLQAGGLVYLTCMGGLTPHIMGTDFHEVITPA